MISFRTLLIIGLILSLALNALGIALAIMPRSKTRRLRRKLSKMVYDQWMFGSWLSSRLSGFLWDSDVNGYE